MKSVNKVILIDNLTRDPKLRHTAENKKAVCTVGLATNRSWPIKPGETQFETTYHRIVAFDKLAETCQQYLKKGRKVYVEGRLQSRTYIGKNGVEKTGVDVVLEELVFLDSLRKNSHET